MSFKKKAQPAQNNDFIGEMGEDFDRFEEWVIQYRKYILAICILIVVVVVAVTVGIQLNKSAAVKKMNTLASAVAKEELVSALKKYPAGPYASAARMRLAKIYIGEKNFKKASAEYKKVAKDETTIDFIKERAALNAAYMTELSGDIKGAIAAFKRIASNTKHADLTRIEASYAAGRLSADVKDYVQARKSFDFVMKKGSALPQMAFFWTFQAKNALAALPAKEPKKAVITTVVKPADTKKTVKKQPAKKTPAKKIPAKK